MLAVNPEFILFRNTPIVVDRTGRQCDPQNCNPQDWRGRRSAPAEDPHSVDSVLESAAKTARDLIEMISHAPEGENHQYFVDPDLWAKVLLFLSSPETCATI